MKKVFAIALLSSMIFAQPIQAGSTADQNQGQADQSSKVERLKAALSNQWKNAKNAPNASWKYANNNKGRTAAGAVVVLAGTAALGYVIYTKWFSNADQKKDQK